MIRQDCGVWECVTNRSPIFLFTFFYFLLDTVDLLLYTRTMKKEKQPEDTQMSLNKIIAECEKIASLQKRIKARFMIYQIEEKELAAEFLGLPRNSFYLLPFGQWVDISHHCTTSRRAQIKRER